MKDMSRRDSSLDVFRIIATFCIVGLHFFAYNDFYSEPVTGGIMFAVVTMRSFFIICVPCFIVLTGYLMSGKTLSGKYYKGISRTLALYLIISIVHIIYRHNFLNDPYDLKRALFKILDFTAAEYGWYVEMYIGLFLMIPFLNLAYSGLATKRHKQVLVLTFIALTSLPAIINTFSFSSVEWWNNPASSADYTKIIPSWWAGIYPLAYYFIGCYLREYGISISRLKSLLLLVVTVLLSGAYNYYRSHDALFQYGSWNDYVSPFTMIITVSVFNIVHGTKWIMSLPAKAKSVLKYLSDLTFGAYLLSYLFDAKLYDIIKENVPVIKDRLIYHPVMVPLIFICAMLASAVVNLIYKALCAVCEAFK